MRRIFENKKIESNGIISNNTSMDKNTKIHNNNKITFSINGMMKVGKSTFINSILGFPLSKTALQRETLMQPIFTYSKTKTNNMKIAKKIETIKSNTNFKNWKLC